MSEIKPNTDQNGVKVCSGRECPKYEAMPACRGMCKKIDGLVVIGDACYPAAVKAFADHAAMDAMEENRWSVDWNEDGTKASVTTQWFPVDEPLGQGETIREAIKKAKGGDRG